LRRFPSIWGGALEVVEREDVSWGEEVEKKKALAEDLGGAQKVVFCTDSLVWLEASPRMLGIDLAGAYRPLAAGGRDLEGEGGEKRESTFMK